MKARLLPLALLSLLLFSCTDSSVAPPQTGDIMPLKVGNMWVGRMRLFDANGSIEKELSDTIKITEEVTINGETWYQGSDGLKYINKSGGLWVFAGDSATCDCKIAEYPAQMGDTVRVESLKAMLAGGGDETVSVPVLVTAVNTQVTVPAGVFSVYRYQPLPSLPTGAKLNIDIEYDFAPNVGMVRRDIHYSSSQRVLWELTSVTLL